MLTAEQKLAYVHISDLVALFLLLVDSIVKEKPIPSGKQGYYFAIAHEQGWHSMLDVLAARLHEHGKVASSDVSLWPTDEVAAQALGVPAGFLHVLFNAE